MVEVLKIKDWKKKQQPQFEIFKREPSGEIEEVRRLRDGLYFNKHTPVTDKGKQAKIQFFLENLIHVCVEVKDVTEMGIEFSIVDKKVVTKTVVKEGDHSKDYVAIIEINNIDISISNLPVFLGDSKEFNVQYGNTENKGLD